MLRTSLKVKMKRPRWHWKREDMLEAIKAVREGTKSIKEAACCFNIPRSTLTQKLRIIVKENADANILVNLKMGKSVFTPEMEQTLVECCHFIKTKYYELSCNDIRELAYQLAVRNEISTQFNNDMAGRVWLNYFMKRHQEFSIKTRRRGRKSLLIQDNSNSDSKNNITNFFDLLETEYSKHFYPPHRIFNVGAIAFNIILSEFPRVIGLKDTTALTSAEKKYLVTAVVCMSAGGNFVPPMMIFPRTKWTNRLMKGAPPGALIKCHPSGWIQHHLFVSWLSHFIEHTKPTAECPALLILGEPFSRMKNLDVILNAKDNHVNILCVPPYTSHKLQPLDKTFMSSLALYYSKNITEAHRTSGGINVCDITDKFSKAYLKAQTIKTAVSGFKCTGIYPLNRSIFTETDCTEVKYEIDKTVDLDDGLDSNNDDDTHFSEFQSADTSRYDENMTSEEEILGL